MSAPKDPVFGPAWQGWEILSDLVSDQPRREKLTGFQTRAVAILTGYNSTDAAVLVQTLRDLEANAA